MYCPECKEYHFKRIQCPRCGHRLTDGPRNGMPRNGKWRQDVSNRYRQGRTIGRKPL